MRHARSRRRSPRSRWTPWAARLLALAGTVACSSSAAGAPTALTRAEGAPSAAAPTQGPSAASPTQGPSTASPTQGPSAASPTQGPSAASPAQGPSAASAAEIPPAETAEPTRPEGKSLGGRVFTHVRAPTSDPASSPLQQVSASAWLEARPRFNEATWARATVSADALATAVDGSSGFRGTVREAYVGASKSGWEVRAGQQIIAWGNADVVNPLDLLGARDYTFFAADSEVSRIGAISVLGAFTPNGGDSPFTATLVLTPVFSSSRLLVPAGVVPAGVIDRGTGRHALALENTELALRLAYVGSGWDVAVVGFDGYRHAPEIELLSVTPQTVEIGRAHRRIVVGGVEASTATGKWTLRLQGAFVYNRRADDAPGATQPSHLHGVLGVERPLGERVRLQLQAIARYAPSFTSPDRATSADPAFAAVLPAIARANALLFDFTERLRLPATARLSYTTEDELFEAEIFALGNAIGGDGLLRPMASLRPSDALRFSAGAEIFFGGTSTPVGALRHYSGTFVEARYTF